MQAMARRSPRPVPTDGVYGRDRRARSYTGSPMCGIVAVVRRPPSGAPPELTPLLESLAAAEVALAEPGADGAEALRRAAATIRAAARALRGPLGTRGTLATSPSRALSPVR